MYQSIHTRPRCACCAEAVPSFPPCLSVCLCSVGHTMRMIYEPLNNGGHFAASITFYNHNLEWNQARNNHIAPRTGGKINFCVCVCVCVYEVYM